MSWRDKLQKASFRDAAFSVAGHDADISGRRIVLHEFPTRDEPFAEDLGKRTPSFSIDAYVVGEDYMTARDALLDACAKPGPGVLVHPYLGRKTVACTQCTVRESTQDGRVARFRLSFAEAGTARYPSAAADTKSGVDLAAGTAKTAIQTRFEDAFNVDGQPGWIAESAGQVMTAAGRRVRAVADLVAGRAGGLSNPAAVLSDQLIAAPDDLIRDAARIVSSVADLFEAVSADAVNPIAVARSFVGLTDFGTTLAPVPATTATRAVQSANQVAIADLVQRAALVEASRSAAAATYASYGEAIALRDDLAGALDGEIESASEAGDDESFTALGALRASVVKHVTAQAPTLARVATIETQDTLPALFVAYRVYGDAGRADELAARNDARHPGFLPAGRLEVLSD